MREDDPKSTPVLDRPIARFAALGVALAAGGVLLATMWSDLFAPDMPDNPEIAACVKQRTSEIDNLMQRGALDEAQAEQLRERAISFCKDAVSGGGGGGPADLPGLGGGGMPSGGGSSGADVRPPE